MNLYSSCWMEESRSTWILSGPVCVSMLTNTFFLVNIVRVLVTKLRAPTTTNYRSGQPPPPVHDTDHAVPEAAAEDCHQLNPLPASGQHGTPLSNGRASVRASSPRSSHHARTGTSLSGLRKAVRYWPLSFNVLNEMEIDATTT